MKKLSIKNKFKNIKNKINKMILKNKNKFTITEVLLFMGITFILGAILGGIFMYSNGTFLGHINASLDEFVNTYDDILENYYQDIDEDELLEAGLDGMISYLGDPYSTLMDKEEADSFNEELDGEYCGIGATIQYSYEIKEAKIIEIKEKSPAEQAGLKIDDIFIKVDDTDVTDKNSTEIANLVKGKKGTKVVITIKRNDELMEFEVVRNTIALSSVTGEIKEINNKKIGYLNVSVFAENTDEQFETELKKLEKEKIESLIIDLRGNSGGHLSTVTNMISLFLPKGKTIYQLKTKDKTEKFFDKTDDKRTYKVVVLVNGGSASASEVFTAALKEEYGATVIGTKTFGKGKVQKTKTLSNGSMIKYTFQEWLTPKGNYIDGVGIEPDKVVEFDSLENDNQLDYALNMLK